MNQRDLAAVLRLLPTFRAVAETEHVTDAAALLGQPQPTVSRALTRLGDLVGAPVVARRGRGIELTPAGRALLPQVVAGLNAIEDGLAQVNQAERIARGRLAIAFQIMLGERVIPALIARFSTRFPGVTYELTQGARQRCLDALLDGGFDVAVVSHPPKLAGYQIVSLFTEPLAVMVPAGHPFAARPHLDVDDLADEPLIGFKHGYGLRHTSDQLLADARRRPRLAFEAEDIHTVRGLVRAGLGIAIVPADPQTTGIEVPLRHPQAHRTVGALVRSGEQSETTAAFVSFLRQSGRSVARAALAEPH